MADTALPRKTREFHNHHFDSTIWNDLRFRDDDIVISTYAKSGTTWLQQIVAQLLFPGADDLAVAKISPWLDLQVPPKDMKLAAVEAQTHRRFLKTHLPVDALVFSPQAKYLYVGRDGRDVLWSLFNHHTMANALWYQAMNETPGLVGPPISKPCADVHRYFLEWLDGDDYPFWPFWENIASWWALRDLPNVELVHFAQLKRDMPGEIRRIAEFLDIDIDAAHWPAIVEHCGFDYMKKHGEKSAPLGGALWEGGANSFLHKGTNSQWKDVLTAEDCRRYEAMVREKLGEPCAEWLATGAML